MTITTAKRLKTHVGNDAATVFPYDFYIPDATSLEISLYSSVTGVTTVLNSATYSITGLGDPNFGSVTYPLSGSPITTTQTLIIKRIVPYTQTVDISNQGGYQPDIFEAALDRVAMQTGQVAEETSRTLLGFPGETFDTTFGRKADIANKYAAFDANGDPTTTSTTPEADAAVTAAEAARDKAQQWAEEAEDTEVETGEYSAHHWALKAAAFSIAEALYQRKAFSQRTVTGATTIVVGDIDGFVVGAVTADVTFSFSAISSLTSNFRTIIKNRSPYTITLDPNSTETINGAATITLGPGQTAFVFYSSASALIAIISGGVYKGTTITINAGSGNWTKVANLAFCDVTAVGPGGGGPTGYSTNGANGGGGAGGVCKKRFLNSDLASSVAYVVGSGGAGGSGTNVAGSNGSANTTFSGLTASLGVGGPLNNNGPGAVGGAASGGDINFRGDYGKNGHDGAANGGHGGVTPFGLCSPSVNNSLTTATAAVAGAGWGFGGASGTGSTGSGATGGDGVILIEPWYYLD